MIEPLLSDDAFLADVDAAGRSPGLHLWWLGQSGYLVASRGRFLLVDPYLSDSLTTAYAGTDLPHRRMTRIVVEPERLAFVDAVGATHAHRDHLDGDTIRPLRFGGARLFAPAAARDAVVEQTGRPADAELAAGERIELAGFEIAAVQAAHPDRRPDTLGYVFRSDGVTVYHSGDTLVFPELAASVAAFAPDVALLPVNGDARRAGIVPNMDGVEAAQLARAVGARLAVPCHYELFDFNTAPPDAFAAECERLGQPYRILRAGERLSLPAAAR